MWQCQVGAVSELGNASYRGQPLPAGWHKREQETREGQGRSQQEPSGCQLPRCRRGCGEVSCYCCACQTCGSRNLRWVQCCLEVGDTCLQQQPLPLGLKSVEQEDGRGATRELGPSRVEGVLTLSAGVSTAGCGTRHAHIEEQGSGARNASNVGGPRQAP